MISQKIVLVSIPLVLAAFTHLWNPIGFPSPHFDEGIYMRRAMHVLSGQGPQEVIGTFALYDHPYFGQLFLAGALSIIGYPNSLNPTTGNVQSIETLYMAPKVLMGLLAILDTFLIYEICQRRYNKTAALIASTLFAITPFTWLLRGIWLESIQLPFILSSILFAVSMKSAKSNRKNILILFSGIFLGLAIFTKIPAVTMIPVVAYLVFNNSNRNLKGIGIWLLPIILIPMIWPVYSIYLGQFSSWVLGIYGQSHREGISLISSSSDFFKIDPLIVVLGILGLGYTVIKKDYLIMLWTIPLLILLYFITGISYFHFLPIFPALCIGAARVIELSERIPVNKIKAALPFIIICVIGIFALTTTTILITTNVNSSHFKASALLTQYLANIQTTNASSDKLTVISDPFYLWIPQYVFDLKHEYVPFYMLVSIGNEKVLFLIDKSFLDGLSMNEKLQKVYNLYATKKLDIIEIGDPMRNGVDFVLSVRPSINFTQDKVTNLVGINNPWTAFNGATISQDGNLDIRINSNNSNRKFSGAVLHEQINLKEVPLILYLEYASKSLCDNAKFFAEITEDKKSGKTLEDYLFNTFYAETTEHEEQNMTPWEDIKNTFYSEIKKGKDGGKILWNAELECTSGNLTSETFLFPRLGAIGNSEIADEVPVQIKLYIMTQGVGTHELTVNEMSLR